MDVHALDGATPAEIAVRGVAGGGEPLPHLERIQASFGHHDVSGVRAHQSMAASEAAQALGAEAFAHGNSVAFGSSPDLHTAAHEAAHVVQQRGSVQLEDGVDRTDDWHERHADAVADAVVAGRSAVPLLDRLAGAGIGGAGAAVQRKSRLDRLGWRNAVIDAENRIQEVIRVAQRDKKGRIQIDLLIDPDFVGLDRHTATGTAPAGKDPDGLAVHKGAEEVLRGLVVEPPSSRRIMSVVLERTTDGWQRNRFNLTGETRSVDDSASVQVSTGQGEIQHILQLAEAARHGEVRMDVAFSPDGVRILSWRSSGSSGEGNAKQVSAERAVRSFTELAAMASGRTLVYELRQKLSGNGWEQEGLKLVGEVKQAETKPGGNEPPAGGPAHDPDDVEQIVADVQSKRRLILTTAGELIADQDPTRLDNILFSIGPLAVVGMLKVGQVIRVGKKWPARAITDEMCRVGCENVARQIHKHVGGNIVRITPKNAPSLGGFRGKSWGWAHHEVVVREGRVYDITTGHQGSPIAEYKQLWQYPDGINFGF